MAFQNVSLHGDKSGCCGKGGNSKRQSAIEKAYRPVMVWEGTEEDTECEKFKRFVQKKYKRHFQSDKDFQRWSVENFEDYWETVWKYFDIVASKPYKKIYVKSGSGILDNDWFTDAKFNYAENLMRYRDDTIAIKYEDEEGKADSVSYAEMFEEVRRYAAAFRKHGLEKGDRVACHMSNRKEAIFAMLATLSIGAIWGGSIPYFGAKAAANIISRMDPKILIAIDRFQDNGVEYDVLSCLPTIARSATTLEKIIVVPSRSSTLSKNISDIKNSCFIHEFLESGVLEDGTVPELEFEQLSASHPTFLSFTSGTTGIAKGTVHSAWVLFHGLASVSFIFDIKKGDVLFNNFPVGWIPILIFIPCLALGATLFLYNSSAFFVRNSRNIWDVLSESKAKYVLFIPSQLDKMEKMDITPKPSQSFEFLRIIALGSCPVKIQNVEFLYAHLSKTTFVSSIYGSTEFFGTASGFYLKSPSYAGEIQLPALGVDIRCYNDDGLPVIGELGTLVVATPAPSLPTYLWKDTDHSVINSNYLSQFPGVWCQNDNCWINPITNGILVKGRSDDTFVQNGDRFGPGDIYFAIHSIEEIVDYICVAQNRVDGDERVVLFVKMKDDCRFTPSLKSKIEQRIETELFEDCVPKVILPVKDIPYNMNNKKMESIIRKILLTNAVPEVVNIKNPECLKHYCNIPEIMDYYKAQVCKEGFQECVEK